MITLTFDTHKIIESLIKDGIEKKQAESIVKAIQSGRDFDLSNLATKVDIAEIRTDIVELKAEMLKWYIATTFVAVGIMISGFAMIINLLK